MKKYLYFVVSTLFFLFLVDDTFARSFQAKQIAFQLRRSGKISIADSAWIKKNWYKLGSKEKASLGIFYLSEPIGSNKKFPLLLKPASYVSISDVNILVTGHFRIIWGKNYLDYVDKYSINYALWGDSDKDGVPYFIEKLAGTDPNTPEEPGSVQDFSNGICEYVWQTEVNTLNFSPPPLSDEYYIDIYIANTGVVSPEGGLITLPDQVNGLTMTYYGSDLPYIIINQDMSLDLLKVTMAHEFFHCIQMSYLPLNQLAEGLNLWLAENSAVWMEDAVYPFVNDYKNFVNQFLSVPWQSLFTDDYVHLYGAAIFLKYITENYADTQGGAAIIRTFWENIARGQKVLDVLDEFFASQNIQPVHSLQAAYTDFVLKNFHLKSFYQDGFIFNEISPVVLSQPEYDPALDNKADLPSPFGSLYFHLTSLTSVYPLLNRLKLDFTGDTRASWKVFLILVEDDGQENIYPLTVDETSVLHFIKKDPLEFEEVYVIVAAVPDSLSFSALAKYNFSFQADTYLGLYLDNGWNLVSIDPEQTGEIKSDAVSLWAWDSGNKTWRVDLPGSEDILDEYVSSKAFFKLTEFSSREGVWVNLGTDSAELICDDYTLVTPAWDFQPGWNLAGNFSLKPLKITDLENQVDCVSVWVWDAENDTWSVALPGMEDDLEAYAASKGFIILKKIYFGQGFWVNVSEM